MSRDSPPPPPTHDRVLPDRITFTVAVFSSLRERLGASSCVVDACLGARVEDLWPLLPGPIRCESAPPGVRYAVNGSWAPGDTPVADGDMVAIILPVSGG